MPETEVVAPQDSAELVETTTTETPSEPQWTEGPNTFDEIDSYSDGRRFDDDVVQTSAEEDEGDLSEGDGTPGEHTSEEKNAQGTKELPKGKSVTLKLNGQEIKASDDAIIVIPVDGQPKEFRIGDLKTDINGREFYARKASEADTKAKQAEAKLAELKPFFEDRKKIDAALQRMSECAEKGDGFGAWLEIMRMQGKDLRAELPRFIQQTDAVRKRWEAMNPQERQALLMKEETERQKRDIEEKESTVQAENRRLKFDNYVAQTVQRTGYSKETLDSITDQLLASGYKFKATDPERRVDEIVAFIPQNHRYNRVQEVLDVIAPEKMKETDAPYLHRIVAFVKALEDLDNSIFSKEEIEDIVRKDLGITKSNGKPKEASVTPKATPKKVASANGTPPKKEPKEASTPNTWDDLENWS